MARKRYSPKLKFQVVLEALTGEKTPGQIAKQYGIHPNSVGLWKKQFLERGAELFAQDDSVQEYERRLADLEQLLGKKEVEIALLKNFLGRNG
jgi:transposase-like protein